ncbi:hypothetical protein MP228_011562 [Amoeboaphelidium protococcarum]|nr:hypothetical protein MP228_011562 [Amoeboaphelidium protococcarum]
MNLDDLNPATLAALSEFLAEQDDLKRQFNQLKQNAESRFSMQLIKEDWQLSQFWYDTRTKKYLTDTLYKRWQLLKSQDQENNSSNSQPEPKIAVISAPSVHAYLHENCGDYPRDFVNAVYCFEFDARFDVLSNFVQYDFNDIDYDDDRSDQGMGKYAAYRNQFSAFMIDPPFLSRECFDKVARFVQFMSVKAVIGDDAVDTIVCSGAVMEPIVKDLLNVSPSDTFHPTHDSPLSNEFKCYTNFKLD